MIIEIINKKLSVISENNKKVYNAAKLLTLSKSKYMHPTINGSVISVNDVNAMEHNLDVKVGSKNLFNDNVVYLNNMKHENGVFTQTNADTREYLQFVIQTYKNNTYVQQVVNRYMYSPENVSYTFTKNDNFDVFRIGHNGAIRNAMCTIDVSNIPNGIYTLQVNVTNATQGSFTWQDIQIEPGETATEYTPYIQDLSGVEVSRHGKNLFDNEYNSNPNSYQNYYNSYYYTDYIQLSPNTKYTLSCNNTDFIESALYFVLANGEIKNSANVFYYPINNGNPEVITFTTDSSGLISFGAYKGNAGVKSNLSKIFSNGRLFQLELGSTATAYEPYIEPQTAVSNADGTAKGLTSIPPSMTLITDTDGVSIECQYYRDIDTYIDNLTMNVALTGGK